jgi:hypothetical protein
LAILAEPTILALISILLLAAADPVPIMPSDFELKSPPPPSRVTPEDCRRSAAAGEIVVCGRNPDQYRAKEIKPPKGVEIHEGGVIGRDIGGARVEPLLEQVGMPGGQISKRIMVTVKVPF